MTSSSHSWTARGRDLSGLTLAPPPSRKPSCSRYGLRAREHVAGTRPALDDVASDDEERAVSLRWTQPQLGVSPPVPREARVARQLGVPVELGQEQPREQVFRIADVPARAGGRRVPCPKWPTGVEKGRRLPAAMLVAAIRHEDRVENFLATPVGPFRAPVRPSASSGEEGEDGDGEERSHNLLDAGRGVLVRTRPDSEERSPSLPPAAALLLQAFPLRLEDLYRPGGQN